jgi:hypothetical protein
LPVAIQINGINVKLLVLIHSVGITPVQRVPTKSLLHVLPADGETLSGLSYMESVNQAKSCLSEARIFYYVVVEWLF